MSRATAGWSVFFVEAPIIDASAIAPRTDVTRCSSGGTFRFTCADGLTGSACKILLATGLRDKLPDIENIQAYYGRSVHHCPYCDAFEHRDLPIAVYGEGDKGAGLALMMLQWSQTITLCSGEERVSPANIELLKSRGVTVHVGRIKKITGDAHGQIDGIVTAEDLVIACSALFFTTGCEQSSDLSARLGCARDDKGGIVADPLHGESSVAGVYVAGDASRDVLLVAVAAGEGAKAAVAINRALLIADGLPP